MSPAPDQDSRLAIEQRLQVSAAGVVASYIHEISDRHRAAEPSDEQGATEPLSD
jgi:hypothetical protein